MRRVLPLTVLALTLPGPAAALAQAPAGGGEQVLARVDRPTPIAAYGGRVVWSRRTAAGDAFQLMTLVDGVTSAVPVPTRSVPFDVDLGPAADGSAVAVYSRCRVEGPAGGFIVASYLKGRGCDIYRYDFATGRESKVDAVSSPTASEAWPTFYRPRLAFARAYDDKRQYPYVYVNDLGDAQGSIRMPGGRRNTCTKVRRTGRTVCSDATRSLPLDLELYGRRLAFAWQFTDFSEGFAYDIRLDDVRAHDGDPRRLATQGGGGLTEIVLGWPAFEAGRAYWSAACFGDPGGCPGRYGLSSYRISTGATQTAATDTPAILSHDRDGGIAYLLIDTQPGTDCMGDPAVPGGTCVLRGVIPSFG
jgi:hypothetical protein